MRLRILGPLEVDGDGISVAVGGPKPRTLLAVLLVHRGTVVSVDRLIDTLWGDQPPPGAVTALRAYLSRVRAALGAPERLRYRAPGYILTVADDELDAAEFEDLLARARAAAAAGDHAQALDLLDAALALWRGEALAEFADLDFARAEAARLAELRLTAAEERIEVLLRLGRTVDAVAEVDSLVRRFPTRERPVTQLMRALYASGRQADALDAYHRLRRRLDDELAVEPAATTRQWYSRILEHDPALVPAAPGAPGGGNLPRRPTELIGRNDELAQVAAALSAAPLVTLTGVGGVGKTRLAIATADRLRDRFPGGVWLCELAALSPGGPVGHAVAVALGVQQRHGLTIEQTVIEYLAHRRLLLVLDNCEHVLDAAAGLADRLVRHCPEVAVLATSREPLGVEGEQRYPVPPLAVGSASDLFVRRVGADRIDFRPDRREAAMIAEICRRLDGLPLAIELAAARMRAMSAAEIVSRLEGDGPLADQPAGGGPGGTGTLGRGLLTGGARTAAPRHRDLAAAIDWSYRLLPVPEQVAFVRMSVFAGGADLAGVHGVCAPPGATDHDTLDVLTRLVDKSLVTVVPSAGRTRYHLLQTLRAYGHERLREEGAAAVIGRRHARYFADLAEQAARGLHGTDERSWVERALPDYDNLRVAFERAAADRDAELALRLVTALPELVHLRVSYEAAGWAERALDFAPPDHPLFAAAAGSAARGAWNRGDFAHARRLAERANGRVPARGTGRIAYPGDVLADVALYEGDVESALRHYSAEAARARTETDQIRLVWTLYYVAVCQAARRTPDLGRPAALESLRVAEAIANPTAQSMARYALGLVLKKSEPDQALALFGQAADLAAAVRNFWWEGIALMELAATRAVHGDPAAAAREFVTVLDHWDRVGDRTQQWLNLRYVVRLLARLGADGDALVLHGFLVAAGKPSPLDVAGDSAGPVLSLPDAVAFARSGLRRHA